MVIEQMCTIQNQDLFDEHQPMLIDGGSKDKTAIINDPGVTSSLMNNTELENLAHASSVQLTSMERISQSSADDTAHSAENV